MLNAYGICAAVGTITFIGSWNSFLWPLLIGQDRKHRTVQVALSVFMTSQRVDYAALFTAPWSRLCRSLGCSCSCSATWSRAWSSRASTDWSSRGRPNG